MSKTIVAILGTGSTATISDIAAMDLVGIQTSSDFITSDITFSTCQTIDGTFVPLKLDTGLSYKIAGAVASSYYSLDYTKLLGVRYVKLTSEGSVIILELFDNTTLTDQSILG